MLSKGRSWRLSRKPLASVLTELLRVLPHLPLPLALSPSSVSHEWDGGKGWIQKALGGLANSSKWAPPLPSGAGDCISDKFLDVAAAAGSGPPHSEVLLFWTCCLKVRLWTSGSSAGT